MFNFFKQDPLKKLDKQYRQLLEAARDLQRKGDIKGFAQKTAEAEAVGEEMERLRKES